MTWSSLVTRVGGMAILLPLVLRNFSSAEVALWLLFGAVAMLQIVGDMGFSQTFTRAISNVRGGADIGELKRLNVRSIVSGSRSPNADALMRVLSAMRPIYFRIALVCLVVLIFLGTYAVFPMLLPVQKLGSAGVWFAWVMVIGSNTFAVWGNVYQAYLSGTERIALLRRWEALFGLLSIVCSCSILVLGGGLVSLVVSQQLWIIAGILRNRWLCTKDEIFVYSANSPRDEEVIRTIWPSAWRSGVGVLMSMGIVQASGFVLARIESPTNLASYMLGLRLIQTISQIASAPFYSKIPLLARLCAEGKRDELINIATRGMKLSNITFLIGFVAVGVLSDYLLNLIGSKTSFPSVCMWSLLGAAFFVERVGAMHIQLYSTTNHVIWHIANGITGGVMILLSYVLYGFLGVVAFPVAMLVSYVLIYCSISCYHSYKAFELSFWKLDGKITILPLLLVGGVWVGLVFYGA
jgi:O-antigen/teichoic acid export membrane protein